MRRPLPCPTCAAVLAKNEICFIRRDAFGVDVAAPGRRGAKYVYGVFFEQSGSTSRVAAFDEKWYAEVKRYDVPTDALWAVKNRNKRHVERRMLAARGAREVRDMQQRYGHHWWTSWAHRWRPRARRKRRS